MGAFPCACARWWAVLQRLREMSAFPCCVVPFLGQTELVLPVSPFRFPGDLPHSGTTQCLDFLWVRSRSGGQLGDTSEGTGGRPGPGSEASGPDRVSLPPGPSSRQMFWRLGRLPYAGRSTERGAFGLWRIPRLRWFGAMAPSVLCLSWGPTLASISVVMACELTRS